jgi:hypothetical protein
MFGKRLDLPALTSGEVPPGLRQRIEGALGVTLPNDFAQIKLYNRHRLGQLQEAVVTFKRSLVLLIAGTVLAFGLALWISPGRRRTILQFGLWLSVSVLMLTYVLRAVRDQLLAMVPDGMYRQGASVAVHEVFTSLRQWGDWMLWSGVVIAVLGYLVGPGRVPVLLRRTVVRGARGTYRTGRAIATSTSLRTWIRQHIVVLRVGGIVMAAIVALWFSSWTALFVIIMILAGYEVLILSLGRPGRPGADVPLTAQKPDVPQQHTKQQNKKDERPSLPAPQ